jgi:hypothetical protein
VHSFLRSCDGVSVRKYACSRRGIVNTIHAEHLIWPWPQTVTEAPSKLSKVAAPCAPHHAFQAPSRDIVPGSIAEQVCTERSAQLWHIGVQTHKQRHVSGHKHCHLTPSADPQCLQVLRMYATEPAAHTAHPVHMPVSSNCSPDCSAYVALWVPIATFSPCTTGGVLLAYPRHLPLRLWHTPSQWPIPQRHNQEPASDCAALGIGHVSGVQLAQCLAFCCLMAGGPHDVMWTVHAAALTAKLVCV